MGARGGAAREVTRAGVRLGNERSNGASTMPSAFPAQMRTAAGKKLASVASGLVGQRGLGVLLDEGLEAGRVGAGKLVHLRLAPEHLHTPHATRFRDIRSKFLVHAVKIQTESLVWGWLGARARAWKVGMAEMPQRSARSCTLSTSTLRKTAPGVAAASASNSGAITCTSSTRTLQSLL